jgi:hypothetical protein
LAKGPRRRSWMIHLVLAERVAAESCMHHRRLYFFSPRTNTELHGTIRRATTGNEPLLSVAISASSVVEILEDFSPQLPASVGLRGVVFPPL